MEKKEVSCKKALNSSVISFLSYTTLTGFLLVVLLYVIKKGLAGFMNTQLSVCLSLIFGILIFIVLHFSFKSGMIDTFKKIKIRKEDEENFSKKMNAFLVFCLILSVVLCLGFLKFNSLVFKHAITQAYNSYSQVDLNLANSIVSQISAEYSRTISQKIVALIIIEFSLVLSFLSLIHSSKNVLKHSQEG